MAQGSPTGSTSPPRPARSMLARMAPDKKGGRLPGNLDRREMVEPGRRAAERLLARTRPDAILCANDLLAVGVLAALREARLDLGGLMTHRVIRITPRRRLDAG